MKGNTVRWLIGSVFVPSSIALLTIFGVQINDWLFAEVAPALDVGDIRQFEHKITAIEANIELLAQLHSRNDATKRPPTQLGTQTQQGSQTRLEPQTQQEPQGEQERQARKFQSLIHVANDSKYLGRKLNVGQREWKWTIYLSGPQEALDAVECVTYRLHPTFPDPLHEICTRSTNGKAFPFTAKGWGTFNINLVVTFIDKTTFAADHYLVFGSEE